MRRSRLQGERADEARLGRSNKEPAGRRGLGARSKPDGLGAHVAAEMMLAGRPEVGSIVVFASVSARRQLGVQLAEWLRF